MDEGLARGLLRERLSVPRRDSVTVHQLANTDVATRFTAIEAKTLYSDCLKALRALSDRIGARATVRTSRPKRS